MRFLVWSAVVAWGCRSAQLPASDRARGVVAPIEACAARFSVPLGDVDAWVAAGGGAPDTAIAFSPDANRVAVGTFDGQVLVFDAWTGERLAAHDVPEALVREVAWSADGRSLWTGEQGPVARVRRWNPEGLSIIAEYAMDADLGVGSRANGDVYAVYALPGIFGLIPQSNGDVLVAGVRGWSEEGAHRNRARLVRLAADGSVVAAWPPDGPADGTLFYPAQNGDRVVVAVGRSADGAAPADLPVDGWQALRATDLRALGTASVTPLQPYFQRVFSWRAVGVDGAMVYAGLGDGRVVGFAGEGLEPSFALDLGTPRVRSGVPLSASIGFGTTFAGGFAVATAETSIPYGTSEPFARPPRPHPDANTLWWIGPEGTVRSRWSGPPRLDGLARSPDGRWLVVGGGTRESDERRDLFGALVFEADAELRFRGFCPTASPVFQRFDVAADGRIAVATHPWRVGAGIEGEYALVVLR